MPTPSPSLFPSLVQKELTSARQKNPPMHSLHEAFAILLEEVDELKAEVWLRPHLRNRKALLTELVQVAAMAQRAAEDLGLV